MAAVSGRYIILLGDKSDHGGTVVTASEIATINGVPIARIFDLHACPQRYGGVVPHGTTPILPNGCFEARGGLDGRVMALEDDRALCGAAMISSQQNGASAC